MNIKLKKAEAFTLIEVLITIGLIIIMLTVTLAILNPIKLRNRAQDGVLQAKMGAAAESLETFYNLRDRYPGQSATNPTPDQDVTDFNNNFLSDSVSASWNGSEVEITIVGLNDGDPFLFDPTAECMQTSSKEDSAKYLNWCIHGAVQKGVDCECSDFCPTQTCP